MQSKNKNYFIGVDLGTNGIKSGIIDDNGNVICSSYWETRLVSKKPGLMEQDPDEFITGTLKIIREITDKSSIDKKNIKAISIDGQMGGIIGIDSDYRSITGYDMGLDVKSEKYNELIHYKYSDFLKSKTCGSPRNLPKILWWKNEKPQIYRKIKKFVTLNSYVAGNICGLKSEDAFIDYTLLAFFGLENLKNLGWSEEFSEILDIDLYKMPNVVQPWKVIGSLTEYAANAAGIAKGTPVIAGAGDQPAGLLGAGFIIPGSLLEVSGSSTLQFTVVERFIPDIEKGAVMYIPSVIKDRFYAFNYINGGGICLRWFRDNFLKNYNSNYDDAAKNPFIEIEKNLINIPAGSDGLIFIPYFGGRQCPYNNKLRGSWIGINWGHKIEHLYKSILESIAYDAREGIENIKRLFPDYSFSEIAVSGGGAKSDVWNQIKADITGLDYVKSETFESNIRGSGILAGYGAGFIEDVEKIASKALVNAPGLKPEVFKADKNNKLIYDNYFSIYKNIFRNSLATTFGKIF
ncbi:MAG: hypothetical protein JW997_04290, partial [Actinobacteria bacterium]|nr:hypothetical protein [Actinomycetota bacterium]